MHASTAVPRSTLLRRALLADAAISGGTGALLFIAATPLATWLGLPTELLRWAGIALLPFAGFVLWIARRETIPRALALAVVIANALWAAASGLLLIGAWVEPTTLGFAFTIGQAVAVALFAELQYAGLRLERAGKFQLSLMGDEPSDSENNGAAQDASGSARPRRGPPRARRLPCRHAGAADRGLAHR